MPLDFTDRVNEITSELSNALQRSVRQSTRNDRFWKSVRQSSSQTLGLAMLTALGVSGIVGLFVNPDLLSFIEPKFLGDTLTKLVPAGQGAVGFWIRDLAESTAFKKKGNLSAKEKQDIQIDASLELLEKIAQGDMRSIELLIGLSRLVEDNSLLEELDKSDIDAKAVSDTKKLIDKIIEIPNKSYVEISGLLTELVSDAKKIQVSLERQKSVVSRNQKDSSRNRGENRTNQKEPPLNRTD